MQGPLPAALDDYSDLKGKQASEVVDVSKDEGSEKVHAHEAEEGHQSASKAPASHADAPQAPRSTNASSRSMAATLERVRSLTSASQAPNNSNPDNPSFTPSIPSATPNRCMLDAECWVEEGRLPPHLAPSPALFEALWALHPPERGEIVMFGKPVKTPRWHQNYLHAYTYSGVLHQSKGLPAELAPYLQWANALGCVQPYGGFNGVLVNWYQDGNDYMGPHSDDESELVRRAPILSISLGQERIFRVTRREGAKAAASAGGTGSTGGTVAVTQQRDFQLPGSSYLVMGGRMQERYKHAVPKVSGFKGGMLGRRINITFRVFKS